MTKIDDVQNWIKDAETQVLTWIKGEDAAIIEFFGPLLQQVKAAALELGKEDLQLGLSILKDAAIGAATAAALAPGDKVAAAESAFLTIGATEGLVAIHNAEAGAIKAAVAIIQSGASALLPTAVAKTVSDSADSVGDEILKKLGG